VANVQSEVYPENGKISVTLRHHTKVSNSHIQRMNPQSFVNSYKGDVHGLLEGLSAVVEVRMESFRKKRDALAATALRISASPGNQSAPSPPSASTISSTAPVSPEVVDLTLSDSESSEYFVVRRKNSRHKSHRRHFGEGEKNGKGSNRHKYKSGSNSSKRLERFANHRQC